MGRITVEGESTEFCPHLNRRVLNAPSCQLLDRQLSTVAGGYPRRPADCPVDGYGNSCQVVSAEYVSVRDEHIRQSE